MSETEFWVLASLAGGRRHGWAVLSDVEQLSAGVVRLKMATLYAALEKLQSRSLIGVDGEEVVNGRTRRYYRLTQPGESALALAAQQRAASARIASSRLAGSPIQVDRIGWVGN